MDGETNAGNSNVVEHPKQHQLRVASVNEGAERTKEALSTQDPSAWSIEDMLRYAMQQHLAGEPIKANGAFVVLVDTHNTRVATFRSGLTDFELFGALSRLHLAM